MTGGEFFTKAHKGELNLKSLYRNGVLPERTINSIAKYPKVKDFLSSFENTWDIFAEVHKAGKLPKMYFAIGTDDFLYEMYTKFKAYVTGLKADVKFEEIDGYQHEWRFWDITIQKAIAYFGLVKDKKAGNLF